MKISETISIKQAANLLIELLDMPDKLSFKSRNIHVELTIKADDFQSRMIMIAELQEKVKKIVSDPSKVEFNQQLMIFKPVEADPEQWELQ